MKHLLLLLLVLSPSTCAENWPQFRGPGGQGRSAERGLPLRWSPTENVAWKTPVPGQGWSSPVVWGDRVLVTTATDEGQSCRVLALDRATGAIRWDREVFRQVPGRKEGRNSHATPTPATDGERVYACFSDGSLAALTLSGELVWTNRSHPFHGQHGLGSSPVLHEGLLIMARDGSSEGPDKELGWQKPWDQAGVLALDARTGAERWRGRRGLSRISHGVPAIWPAPDGRTQVVSEAGDVVQGFDLQTGERLWSSQVIGEGKVPSTVIGEGLVFTAGGWGGRESIKAFRLATGGGDLGTNNLAWEQRKGMPRVPSMLYVAPHLYALTDAGVLTCLRAATGEILWQERLGGACSASPVYADGHLYCVGDDGTTTVLAAGAETRVIARNPLGEKVQASPAVSGGRLYIRTGGQLVAVGTPGPMKDK